MNTTDFTYEIKTTHTPEMLFDLLLEVENWWYGVFNESITGQTKQINDEFTFAAGDGMHYSRQRLVSLEPGKQLAWLVTESNLSFLKNPGEWEGTTIEFMLSREADETRLTFTHHGLNSEMECYDSCSPAWTQYLKKLEEQLTNA